MYSEFRMDVYEDGKIIESCRNKSEVTNPMQLIKSLQDFQGIVNSALTNIISNSSCVRGKGSDEEIYEDSDSEKDDEEQLVISPKKQKL